MRVLLSGSLVLLQSLMASQAFAQIAIGNSSEIGGMGWFNGPACYVVTFTQGGTTEFCVGANENHFLPINMGDTACIVNANCPNGRQAIAIVASNDAAVVANNNTQAAGVLPESPPVSMAGITNNSSPTPVIVSEAPVISPESPPRKKVSRTRIGKKQSTGRAQTRVEIIQFWCDAGALNSNQYSGHSYHFTQYPYGPGGGEINFSTGQVSVSFSDEPQHAVSLPLNHYIVPLSSTTSSAGVMEKTETISLDLSKWQVGVGPAMLLEKSTANFQGGDVIYTDAALSCQAWRKNN